MHITVFLEREHKKKKIALANKATAHTLLTKLHINPETVLIVRNKQVILPETPLRANDQLKLLSVISGG